MSTYHQSTGLIKLKEAKKRGAPLRLAFLDIDGTWAGPPAEQQTVRKLLEDNGYVTGVVTSRLAQMCIDMPDRSPTDAQALQGLLNPDIIIAATGTELMIKQTNNAYLPDTDYCQRLPHSAQTWHQQVQKLLAESKANQFPFQAINLPLPNFRVELQCQTQTEALALYAAITNHSNASSFHIAREDYKIFITPLEASKEDAVTHVVSKLVEQLEIPLSSIHMLLAGDSAVEATMSLVSSKGTQVVFLVPGGASLYQELHQPTLQFFAQELTKSENGARLPAGVYQVKNQTRRVIFGDEAFPDTAGPQTLIAWLRQAYT